MRRAALVVYGLAALAATRLGAQPVTIPERLEAVLAADQACNLLSAKERREASRTARLEGGKTLYVVLCDRAAYNTTSRLFVRDGSGAFEPLYFAEFNDELGWTGATTLFGANYDAKTRVLTSLYAGRGPGDCGSAGRWRWTDAGFRMLEYRAWSDCEHGRPQAKWPVVYRAKPERR